MHYTRDYTQGFSRSAITSVAFLAEVIDTELCMVDPVF